MCVCVCVCLVKHRVSCEKRKTNMAEQQQNVVDYNQLQVIIQQLVRNEMQPVMQQAENHAKQALDQTTASTSTNFSKLKAKLDRQRLNDNITFTKAGHTDQFKHNQQVLEVIDDTLEAMESKTYKQ
uniref:Uncharacterized protein n=1 Tax=Clytia hemisphaerica TaxID=252671 RepID=A0A7M5XKG3_9CNID